MKVGFDWIVGLMIAGVVIAIVAVIGLPIWGLTDLGYSDYLKGWAKLIAAVLLLVVVVAFIAGTEAS